MNLPADDNHCDATLIDSSAPATQILRLFAIIILICFPSNPHNLWDNCKDDVSDNILHQVQRTSSNFDFKLTLRPETRHICWSQACAAAYWVNWECQPPNSSMHNNLIENCTICNSQSGLRKETRLTVRKLMNNVIQASIIKGKGIFISRYLPWESWNRETNRIKCVTLIS